jgi:hypothetical protein
MYVQWEGMPFVEMRRADKATENDSDSVTKCEERTATVCEI